MISHRNTRKGATMTKQAATAKAIEQATAWAVKEADGIISIDAAKMIVAQLMADEDGIAPDWHEVQIQANRNAAAIIKSKTPAPVGYNEDEAIAKAKAAGAKKNDTAGNLDAGIKRAIHNWKLHPLEGIVVKSTLRNEDVAGKSADEIDHLIRIVRRAMRKTIQTVAKK